MQPVRRSILHGLLGSLSCLLVACSGGSTPEAVDVLIVGGTVVDGTGAPATRLDVAIKGGRITAIAPDLSGTLSMLTINADDLVVSPGFIEPHAHITNINEVPSPENFLRQGITTVVNSLHSLDQPYPLGPFLDSLEVAPNTVWTAGHTWVRKRVVGLEDREPTAAEMAEMKRIVAEAMDDGAIGLGTGLEYIPAVYARPEEVIALARVTQRPHAVYTTHMRDEGRLLPEALEEALDVVRATGIPLHISHIKSTGRTNAGVAGRVLDRLDEATREGLKVSFDVYPYDAYSTYSTVLFPSWALAGGTEAFRERIADPQIRTRLKAEMREIFVAQTLGSLDSVIFRNVGDDWSRAGVPLSDWLTAQGRPVTFDEGLDALIELQAEGGFIGIFRAMADEDIDAFLLHPLASVSGDGDLVVFGEGFPHPRSYGAFPRVLGRYVRERGLMTLEEAVSRMTSRPADDLGIADRGRLVVGAHADVVVFDANRIIDRATFEDPHQYAEGIVHVLINGVPVIQAGAMTGAVPGLPLRRQGMTR